MADLTYRYGVMGSSKTLHLLVSRFQLMRQGKKVGLYKPPLDTRSPMVASRITGIEAEPDDTSLEQMYKDSKSYWRYQFVFIDEAQFLTEEDLHYVYSLTAENVPVYCYGLKTDFRTKLFPASADLLANADVIEEIPALCTRCTRKAIYNMRLINGLRAIEGPQVQVGGDETYEGVCKTCYWLTLDTDLK